MDTSQDKLTSFGNDYTKAWNSQKPENVASFFAEKGALIVNGGEPLTGRKELTEFAKGFMTAFPDLKLSMDSLASTPNGTDYHWSFVGTNTDPNTASNIKGLNSIQLHYENSRWWIDSWTCQMESDTNSFVTYFLTKE